MPYILCYLDLGAGSIMLQTIVATILGFSFAIKTYWRRVIGVFRPKQKDSEIRDSETSKNSTDHL